MGAAASSRAHPLVHVQEFLPQDPSPRTSDESVSDLGSASQKQEGSASSIDSAAGSPSNARRAQPLAKTLSPSEGSSGPVKKHVASPLGPTRHVSIRTGQPPSTGSDSGRRGSVDKGASGPTPEPLLRPASAEVEACASRLFEAFADEDGLVSTSVLLQELVDAGLLLDDPRLRSAIASLKALPARVSREQFGRAIGSTSSLMRRAAAGELIVPDFQQFVREFDLIFHQTKAADGSSELDEPPSPQGPSSPGLASSPMLRASTVASMRSWGAAFCTVDGQRHGVGDAQVEFCLQESVGPLLYALALQNSGVDTVHQHIGREHSGSRHSDISVNKSGLPHNPFTEAGRIMAAALIRPSASNPDRYAHVLKQTRRMAGGQRLGFSQQTNLHNHEHFWHAKAIAHFIRECRATPASFNLDNTLSLYLQLCAVEISPETGAIIAATLANGGVCPITSERILEQEHVRDVLALMHTCGMDTLSGEWAFSVGFPAKNSSSGCILAVVPGVMGVCSFSPELRKDQVSRLGFDFFKRLVRRFALAYTASKTKSMDFVRASTTVFLQRENCYIEMTPDLMKLDPRMHVQSQEETSVAYVMHAAREGDLGAVMRARRKGLDISITDYNGRTALHVAAAAGHLKLVRYLAGVMRDVSPVDCFGCTPLDDAVRNKRSQVAEELRTAERRSRVLRRWALVRAAMRIASIIRVSTVSSV